jgi:hypothetical protein
VDPGPINDYEQEWRHYRLVRNVRNLMLVAVFLFPVWIAFLPANLPARTVPFAAAMCVILLCLTELRLDTWRCPRCKHWFFTKMTHTHVLRSWWVRKCVHCGLPKYATGDDLANLQPQSNPR